MNCLIKTSRGRRSLGGLLNWSSLGVGMTVRTGAKQPLLTQGNISSDSHIYFPLLWSLTPLLLFIFKKIFIYSLSLFLSLLLFFIYLFFNNEVKRRRSANICLCAPSLRSPLPGRARMPSAGAALGSHLPGSDRLLEAGKSNQSRRSPSRQRDANTALTFVMKLGIKR